MVEKRAEKFDVFHTVYVTGTHRNYTFNLMGLEAEQTPTYGPLTTDLIKRFEQTRRRATPVKERMEVLMGPGGEGEIVRLASGKLVGYSERESRRKFGWTNIFGIPVPTIRRVRNGLTTLYVSTKISASEEERAIHELRDYYESLGFEEVNDLLLQEGQYNFDKKDSAV